MPELPDVETFKRYLDATSLHQRIAEVGLVKNVDEFLKKRALGPDALDVDASQFKGIFAKHRGAVKSILMNQRLIAGIGNIYADEILFHARIHPATEIGRLGEKNVGKLF